MARTTKNSSAAAENALDTVHGIRVRSFPEEFRRAGRVFTREAVEIELDDLSEKELQAIATEPMLSVQAIEMTVVGAKDSASSDNADEGNA